MNENDTTEIPDTKTIIDIISQFAFNLSSDPAGTIRSDVRVIVALIILILSLAYLLRSIGIKKSKVIINPLYTLTEYPLAKEASSSEKLWVIGVSERSISIAEDGVLITLEFTANLNVPTAEHCFKAFEKAVCEPFCDSASGDGKISATKPRFVIFLETVLLDKNEVDKFSKKLSDFGISVTTRDDIAHNHPELLVVKADSPLIPFGSSGKQEVIANNDQPSRGCSSCRKDIVGKASQCSACKAIIYCSAICAKSDWVNHKQTCSDFKKTIDHLKEWNLHEFPFTFYETKTPLCNYNIVPYLTTVSRHNVGLYQRLCGCYQQLPWGSIGAQLLSHFQSSNSTQKDMFDALGLEEEMFSLSRPFKAGVDVGGLDSWTKYYEARDYSFDNCAALLLEVPLTVWYLINQFHLKTSAPIKSGERRKVTVHLVGVEKEADLVLLFECLLPLMPKTDIAIHMIGNMISSDIPPEQRAVALRSSENDSSIFISLNTCLYQPQHLDATAFALPNNVPKAEQEAQNFGTTPPDLVICMNAALVFHQEWAQTISMIAQSGRKLLVTERMEHMCNAAERNLPKLNARLNVGVRPNPFKQPLYDFKKDVNLPGWSNGFIMGIGKF